MTRIIGGTAGGRTLVVPPGGRTRPTSDRVREALFSALNSRGLPDGARVLDLYAGSGALGLEAASRGAVEVVLVDSWRAAVEAARRNVAALGLPGVRVVPASCERFVAVPAPQAMDLVFLDPPYALAEPDLARVLGALVDGGWVAEGGVVVVERSARGPEPGWPEALSHEPVRRYGETAVWTAARC